MRFSFALPALAGGLVLAWAAMATAAADAPPAASAAPPAAPIFYCPTGSAKPAQAAACPTPPPAHAVAAPHRAPRRAHQVRYAVRRTQAPREDVSASQRFIYNYERAQHGLDARAADEAWARGGPPPCRGPHGCPPPHPEWAEAPPPPPQVIVERAPPQPPQVIVERAPPPPPQVIIERAPPPPPKIIIEHPPAPPPQIVFERAPPAPPRVIYERGPACPDQCPPASYGYEERGEGAGYAAGYGIERHESERSGGWRYSETDGRGRYEEWGDAPRHRPCPPPAPAASCAGDGSYGSAAYGSGGYAAYAQGGYASSAYASGEAEWRDGSYGRVYTYSGRDAGGYLVWPGKTGP